MSFGYSNNLNNISNYALRVNFRSSDKPVLDVITAPIDDLSEKIEKEKRKKSTKTAIGVGVTVTILTGLVAVFNPRYSANFVKRLQGWQKTLLTNADKSKGSFTKSKFYKYSEKVLTTFMNAVNFVNNVNPMKDIYVKNFCCNEKEFLKVEDFKKRETLKKIDKRVVKITGGIHRKITQWFDSIGQFKVKLDYKMSARKLDNLENKIKANLDKLSASEKEQMEKKLAEIAEYRKCFNKESVEQRLKSHADSMVNLERDFLRKFRDYREGYENSWVRNGDHFVKNMNYWPEEILKPKREVIEKQGSERIEKLLGNGKDNKGLYKEIIETLKPHLDKKEAEALSKTFSGADKNLRYANTSECIKYFDKKRDLIMGSAPTDILSATIGLIGAGAAVAAANNKDKRLSRTVTAVIPTIAGLGTSIAMTAMLVSGGKGLLAGLVAGFLFNRAGVLIDRHILGNNEDEDEYDDNNKKQRKEQKNV